MTRRIVARATDRKEKIIEGDIWNMANNRFTYGSPIGAITIEDDGDGNIVSLFLQNSLSDARVCETDAIKEAAGQLAEYFAGTRRSFDVRLRPEGTEFQRRMWKVLCDVPYGMTRTYGELAADAGCPGGARAAGMAMNCNPISIFQPCHRIIGSDGKMTGFACGIAVKEFLLRLEGSLK